MTDNVVLNSGSGGVTAATDDVAGVHYQRVKLVDGTLDSTAAIPGDATNGLFVNVKASALPSGAATSAKQPALGTAGTASTDVITVQGIASMTKLLVTPDSVALPANQSVNVNQLAGTTTDTNSGNKSAGTLRVVVATDQPQLTNALKVDGSAVTQPVSIATNQPAGNVASGTADSGNPLKVGGKYNLTPITLTDGNRGDLQLDANGYLCVDIKAGAGSGGTALADNATFTRGTTSETPVAGVVETSAPTLTNGKAGALSLTTGGALRVDVSSGGVPGFAEDAAHTSGDSGVEILGVRRDTAASSSGTDGDYSTLNLNSVGQLYVADLPVTSQGLSFNGFVGAASNNKTQIKGSAGQLYFVSVQNLAATPVYLKVFNNVSASVTMGTTNCDFQFMVPGNTAGAGFIANIDKGIALGTGITIALTAGIGTADNTSVSANNQVVTIGYK